LLGSGVRGFTTVPKLCLEGEGDATPDHTEVVVCFVQEMPAEIGHYANVSGKAKFKAPADLTFQQSIIAVDISLSENLVVSCIFREESLTSTKGAPNSTEDIGC